MKFLAIFLVLLFLAALGLAGYACFTADITVAAITTVAVDAADQQPTFDAILSQVEKGQFIGTVFDPAIPDKSEDCQFIVYTVRLRNTSAIPAERVEVEVTPIQGDMVQMGDTVKRNLAKLSQGDLTATILTRKDAPPQRRLKITCYLWGIPFTIHTTSTGEDPNTQ